jgi:hypothetical protein
VDYYFGRLNRGTDKMTSEYKAMYDSAVAKNMEFSVGSIKALSGGGGGGEGGDR